MTSAKSAPWIIAAVFVPLTSSESTPGLEALNGTSTPGLTRPRRCERTVKVTPRVAANSGGNCASICVGEVLMRGIAISFAVTQTPPSNRGSGGPLADAASARLLPNMEISDPGEIRLLRVAVFTTPLA